MLFVTQIELTPGNQKTVALLAKVTIEGRVYLLDFRALLSNSSAARAVSTSGHMFYVDSVEGLEMPFTVVEDVMASSATNFTQVYKLLLQQNEEGRTKIFNELPTVLAASGIKIESEDVKAFYQSILDFQAYLKKEIVFRIDIPANYLVNYQRTSQLISEINNSQEGSLKFLNSSINKTEFMRTPKDKVFLKIPSFDEIYTQSYESLLPIMRDVFQPYRKPEFRQKNYKYFLSQEDNELAIIGNADNNDLGIQENELEFYEALKELVNYGIKQAYPDKDLEDCIKHNVSSPDVKDYLIRLALEAGSWNWSHTGMYPVGRADDDVDNENDDDDDGKDTGEVHGNKLYTPGPSGEVEFSDAEEIVREYIESATLNNIYAPCEAIIKMLRWGDRKPTRLKLEGSTQYLDLNTYYFYNQSGSFANLEVVKVGGANMQPIAVIMANGKFADVKYLTELGLTEPGLNIPVGLLCVKKFSNNDVQLVHMSIVDYVDALLSKDTECTLAGIKLENGNILVENNSIYDESLELSESVARVRNDISAKEIFYKCGGMKDLYMKYNIPANKVSHLTILEDLLYNKEVSFIFLSQTFVDQEDLVERVKQYNLPVQKFVDNNVGKNILPIVLNVAQRNTMLMRSEGREYNLQELLNLYKEFILKLGYTGELNITKASKSASSQPVQQEVNPVAARLTKMTGFGETDSVAPVKTSEPSMELEVEEPVVNGFNISSLFEGVQPTDLGINITDKDEAGNVEVIGKVVMKSVNGKKYYIFAKKEVELTATNQNANIKQLLKFMMNTLYMVGLNKPESLNCKFTDLETLGYYSTYLANRKW